MPSSSVPCVSHDVRQIPSKYSCPKTARSRVPLFIFFVGVITPGNSPVSRGGMMRGRIQSGTWHKEKERVVSCLKP